MVAELTVRRTIKEHDLIKKGDNVVLGFSGGPDSLCLLSILHGLERAYGFKLSALHVNHKIRGAAAESDALWAKEFCEKEGIAFKLVEIDVPGFAKEKGLTEEEAGRLLRHKVLFEEAKRLQNGKVALAHNKNDQAETVLLRIIRGTGVHGLSAMEYKRSDGLIRPLLDVTRSEIEAYCQSRGLEPRVDKTNFETDHTRNKIRNLLIPLLEKEYNPSMTEALSKLSKSAKSDDEALLSEARNFLKEKALPKGPKDALVFNVKDLAALPMAVFARLVTMSFSEIGLAQDVSAAHINAFRSAVLKNFGGKVIEFPGGFEAVISKGKATLFQNNEKYVK